ncbi:hypothetical protein [Xaviernesmea oryzae]|uniref:hypothetical protein n=1 Tax=Xaviernesmea oryzae TaxID=464029 RepID=UPI0008D722D1|nr:hypothetical protein [Xaviernesmea oryzae]SEK21586.1 hypothetical protein SAMN04487976_101110 [Xaviernesmea oryzae]
MSNDNRISSEPSEEAIALFLANDNGDALTDLLVAALDEAFEVLSEAAGTVH